MKKSLDFSKSLEYFFQLKDWQNRSMFFGGILVASIVVYMFLILSMLIPVIGIFIYCAGIVVMALLAILFVFYMNGYKVLVAQAVMNHKSVEEIKVAADWGARISVGFKLAMANLVYYLPTYFIYFLGFLIMFVPLLLNPTNRTSSYSYNGVGYDDQQFGLFMVATIIYYCLLCIAWVVQMVTEYFVFPMQMAVFLKDQKFSTAVSPSGLINFWKRNSKNILLLGLLLFAMSIAFIIVVGVSVLTLFLCVGIILLPVVYAVGFTYMLHLQAHLVGSLAKHDKEN